MTNVIDFNAVKAKRDKSNTPVADVITLKSIKDIIEIYKTYNIDLTNPLVRKEILALGMVLNGITNKINGDETTSTKYLKQILNLFDAVQEKKKG